MKLNVKYVWIFIALAIVEVMIARYVHDLLIRPYVGDVLVVILLYCLVRIFVEKPSKWLPAYLFVFAVVIELLQWFHVVSLLGLTDQKIARIIIGTTFDVTDIVCYFAGMLLLFLWQMIDKRNFNPGD